jgi:hypothetical protein
LQELDGGDEITLPNGHDQVDGVEVALAAKATAEIGARVDCREEFFAQRAQKAAASVSLLVRPLQSFQEMVNGGVVAKLI